MEAEGEEMGGEEGDGGVVLGCCLEVGERGEKEGSWVGVGSKCARGFSFRWTRNKRKEITYFGRPSLMTGR